MYQAGMNNRQSIIFQNYYTQQVNPNHHLSFYGLKLYVFWMSHFDPHFSPERPFSGVQTSILQELMKNAQKYRSQPLVWVSDFALI